jgi:hypothetical protein
MLYYIVPVLTRLSFTNCVTFTFHRACLLEITLGDVNNRTLVSPIFCKKSFKIPKGQSEFVYRRRTDNTMVKRKVQKDKQRSTKHTYKTKDRVTRTPLKSYGLFSDELGRGW